MSQLGEPEPTEGDTLDPAPPAGPAGDPAGGERMSAILTAPNVISFTRLLLMPVCAWLLASGRWGAGLWLTAVVGSTDWVDGWLARRTGSVSRLGQGLDPLADRLLIASVTVALLVRGVVPPLAVVLLVGRDLVLLIGFPLLARRGVRPPDVVWVGKAATFDLLFALPALVWGETSLPAAAAIHLAGVVLLWLGVVLYYVTGAVYVRQSVRALRRRAAGA